MRRLWHRQKTSKTTHSTEVRKFGVFSKNETRVKKYNVIARHDPYEQEYFLIDGVCITFIIPFDGNPELFQLRPSSYIMTHFSVATKFESNFKNYRTMIGNVNSEVKSFNANLHSLALNCLNARKEKASSFAEISKMLEIPLRQNASAPNVTPVKLTRISRTPVQQVLNYSTWRDAKVSVIIFNKENQAFSPILDKITSWVNCNTKSHRPTKANSWDCTYYRADMEMNIKLNIVAFDLYVDEKQFQDKRYK